MNNLLPVNEEFAPNQTTIWMTVILLKMKNVTMITLCESWNLKRQQ